MQRLSLYFVLQVVRVIMDNMNNGLLNHMNSGLMPPYPPYVNRSDVVRWTAGIVRVIARPPSIELTRALPMNVELSWRPELHEWVNFMNGMKRNNTGVADLTLR
jgi:hypothetical protein